MIHACQGALRRLLVLVAVGWVGALAAGQELSVDWRIGFGEVRGTIPVWDPPDWTRHVVLLLMLPVPVAPQRSKWLAIRIHPVPTPITTPCPSAAPKQSATNWSRMALSSTRSALKARVKVTRLFPPQTACPKNVTVVHRGSGYTARVIPT